MNKAYNRINWENYPSLQTPLNEQNLNRMDGSMDVIDDRVIALDTTKFNKSEAQGLIKNITFDLQTGILTKYYYNGSTEEINTGISKLNMNLRFDKESQILYVVNADGTEDPIDLSAFITNYEFRDSDTIAHNVSSDGTVTSIVKDGSITEDKLQPNYLADIKVEVAKAQMSATNAAESATAAENSKKLSESYAHGGTGIREGEDEDNAKKYKELAEQAYENLQKSTVTGVKGNAESTYRQGNINLTPENIGALPRTGGTVTGTLILTKSGDASGTADNRPELIVGKPTSEHIEIDSNEVMAKSDGVTPSALILNRDGGRVDIGTKVHFAEDGTVTAPKFDGNATSATNATKDGNGNNIADTYLTKTGDSANNTVTFTSGDNANPSAWTDVSILTTGEKHSSLFNKISNMVKNVRYLWKLLGSTSLSGIGDGTVTGAVSALNTGLTNECTTPSERIPLTPVNGTQYDVGCWYFVRGSKVHVHLSIADIPAGQESKILVKLPAGKYPKNNEMYAIGFATFEKVGMIYLSTNGNVFGMSSDGYVLGDFEYYWR